MTSVRIRSSRDHEGGARRRAGRHDDLHLRPVGSRHLQQRPRARARRHQDLKLRRGGRLPIAMDTGAPVGDELPADGEPRGSLRSFERHAQMK